jgi:ADP-ribose pyrophosphatase YjhB (NUDIX family)
VAKLIEGARVGRLGKLAIGCSASIFDVSRQKMLLVRRSDNGCWAVPGGYMEPGESVSEACLREVWEETGLHVQVSHLIAVYSTPHKLLEYPDGNRIQLVVLHFMAEPVGGDLRVSNETTELKHYSRNEIEDLDIRELDSQRIKDGFAFQKTVIIR